MSSPRRVCGLPVSDVARVLRDLLPVKPIGEAVVVQTSVATDATVAATPTKAKGVRRAAPSNKGAKNSTPAEADPTTTVVPVVAAVDPTIEYSELLRGMLAVDPEYAAIYSDESDKNLREVRTQLARLEVQPDDVETLRVVRRLIHNLKGAAGTVGFKLAATLAHRIEDVLDRIGDGAAALAGETLSLVDHAVDALEDLAGRGFDNNAMSRRLAELFPRLSAAT